MLQNENATGSRPMAFQEKNSIAMLGSYNTTKPARFDIELIKSKVSLSDLVEQAGTKLHRSGHEMRGICPLHRGDNPTAFSVYAGDDGYEHWTCFTRCNASGDVIDFVQRQHHLDFVSAVKYLAETSGISLEQIGFTQESAQAERKRREAADVLDLAVEFYKNQLWSRKGSAALAYVLKRGFKEETIQRANWGFSTSGHEPLEYLESKQADSALARDLGLLRADGLDFTANANGKNASPSGYIIYPHVWNGRTVYLSARALDPIDEKDKARNLPGERQVYWALVQGDPNLIIVEGQADSESLRQLGYSAVALCGVGELGAQDRTRVTNARTIYLALDNDLLKQEISEEEKSKIAKSKSESTDRLCETLGPLTMIVPDLPYKDFNEWLQQSMKLQELETHLKTSQAWLDQLIETGRSIPPAELNDHLQIIARHVRGLPPSLQAQYARLIEKVFNLGSRDVRKLLLQSETANPQIYSEIKDNRLHSMGDPLGNFWALIQRELTVDDGLNPPSIRYLIKGGLATGELLHEIQVEAGEFVKMDWAANHWGMRAIMNLPPGKSYILARAIQEISMNTVIREKLYTFTGWNEDDHQRGFLSSNGMLTPQGMQEQIRVDLGTNNMQHYALPGKLDNLAAGVQASLEFLSVAPLSVTAPLWAAMFAAPLTGLRSLNAVISVDGTTQSGKSILVHLALTHFGSGFIQGHDYRAPIDWTSTKTAIEAAMFTAKDVAIVVDDYAPQFTSVAEARSMRNKAEYVIRSVGNRSGRGRARPDLSQQITRYPRGVVLMTAENPLVGQSIVGRMIYVPVKPGDVLPTKDGEDCLSPLQAKAEQGLLSQAMAAYIQYLAMHWDHIAETFPAMVDQESQNARISGNLQNRLPDAYGVLAAAQELALQCFADSGFISNVEAERMSAANKEALLTLIRDQAEQIANESPLRKFFIAIESLLESGKVYLAPRTQSVQFESPKGADLIGYYEPESEQKLIFLRTEVSLAQAKLFWHGLDENLDIMPDALRRQMKQKAGLLAETGERQVEVTKYCNGGNKKVLEVDAKKVEEFWGISILKEE